MTLEKSVSHYLVKVLRLKEGDRFWGFNGLGLEREFILKKANAGEALAAFSGKETQTEGEAPLFLALAQSLPKGSKMDSILRQGTEIGVNRFIPMVTQRSVSRPEASQSPHKEERWRKILVEACRQCGRMDLPRLDGVTSWKDTLKGFEEFDLVLIPYEKEAPALRTVLESGGRVRKVLTLVGPEGGWTVEEIAQAREAGARVVHLPTPILRTETAGLVAVSMLRYSCGEPPTGG
jgi:16S rRNA (uracil1498-N3)-methyltransferase